MRNILWLGPPYFAHALADCGWQNVHVQDPPDSGLLNWDDVTRMASFIPDVVVIADNGLEQLPLGMENFPCLTVFYSVHSHIHPWQGLYAQAFDACLVSPRDHIPRFAGEFLHSENIWWSPPFAADLDQPEPRAEKIWDCLFVGTNDIKLKPMRHAFLATLGKLVPGLKAMSGDYRQYFPKARVLVNHAEGDDLNFRVFEAMGCGGCLVTPRTGHGMAGLFVDGEQLVGYVAGDAGDAAQKINFLLENPDICEYIGQTALEEVNARHRPLHRAETFTDHLCDLALNDSEGLIAKRIENSEIIQRECLASGYLKLAAKNGAPGRAG